MRVGTPGFTGSRLKEAREARGVSVNSLAELAEVTTQAIYGYEGEKSSPSPAVLDRLASALNMPEAFFTFPARREATHTVFARSMVAATKAARTRADRRFTWLQDITHYVSQFVELPASNFPQIPVPDDPLLLSSDDIEHAAETLRQYWNMGTGPVANMVLLLENQGAIVARDTLGAETLDGLSAFVAEDQRPYVLIGTDKGTPARWRFDAAHELGHVILHAHVPPQQLARPEYFRVIEDHAHRFAAAFLLPMASFGDELYGVNLDALRALKPRWNVSIAMMIQRAKNGGLISEDAARKLWINYTRRKWRQTEPLDETTEPEQPRLLRRAVELILDRGAQTPADIIGRLALPAVDIESLTGLPRCYLSGHSRVSLIAPQAAANMGAVDPMATPAQVIQFPLRRRES